MQITDFISRVRGRLIVSCQALEHEPLYGAHIMARMAVAAQVGGAAAIRANFPADVEAIKAAVTLPVIGLYKDGDSGVYITPTVRHIVAIIDAGADVIAFDATMRERPNGETIHDQIAAIHARGRLALADVSTLEEALNAQAAGVDLAAPTLSGYTPYSPPLEGPDFALIQAMAQTLTIPVIAEGRIRTPQEARLALDYGALAVVVGGAITRPQLITEGFVKALAQS
ncbi:MAG: N-acetylmannosamine-6-phosphate 2-epimerase [bacterium]|nr:N-acetylmannosamine-6-phosphate 2-epimerase [bacterium]